MSKKCDFCFKVNLSPDDIHVTYVYIDRGLKDQDPIAQTSFYKGRFHEHSQIENMVETCHVMSLFLTLLDVSNVAIVVESVLQR